MVNYFMSYETCPYVTSVYSILFFFNLLLSLRSRITFSAKQGTCSSSHKKILTKDGCFLLDSDDVQDLEFQTSI